MRPEVDQILGLSTMQLMTDVVPQVAPGYAQSTANIIALMVGFCAGEYDRAAEMRSRENAQMRAMFAEISASVRDVAAKEALAAAAQTRDASLKVSDLNTANNALRKVLIQAQAALEEQSDAAGKAALGRIWAFLKASADERMLRLPGA